MELGLKIILLILGVLIVSSLFMFIIIRINNSISRKRKINNSRKFDRVYSQSNNHIQNFGQDGKIYSLTQDVNSLKQKINDLEGRFKRIEAINVLKTSDNNEVSIIDNNPTNLNTQGGQRSNIEFYKGHKSGVFERSKALEKVSPSTFYRIEVSGSTGKIFLLTGKMDAVLIADKDIFLENVCEITYLHGSERKSIIETKPGIVTLRENSWVVSTKIEINIQ